MKANMKRWTAWLMVIAMLLGLVPGSIGTVQAEELAVTEELVTEEEKEEEPVVTEAPADKQTTEAEEETTEAVEEAAMQEEADSATEEAEETDMSLMTEEEPEAPVEQQPPEDMGMASLSNIGEMDNGLNDDGVHKLEASDAYLVCSDGKWGGGYVWYVQPGNSKHYIFCLNKGGTMHDATYTGKLVYGYSGKSAFKKGVALDFFYQTNGGSWSGKKNYGAVQEVIWDEAGSDTAKALTTYIDYAWKLTGMNSSRSAGGTSFNSKLLPISKSAADSAEARKNMISSFPKTKTKTKVTEGEQTQISLGCDAWKYFAAGGYSGTGAAAVSGAKSTGISVVGVYDTDGKKTGSTAFVDDKGNLQVTAVKEENKVYDKKNPLTVIMKVNFDYRGATKIRYLQTGDGIQDLTFDADFGMNGYFALQVYADQTPDIAPTKVCINKIDEYGQFVPGCTFRLTGTMGAALENGVDSGDVVIDSSGEGFKIEYPGAYQIVETGVPSDEYEINPTVYRFMAEYTLPEIGSTEEPKLVLSNIGDSSGVTQDPSGVMQYTYTCENKFNSGGAQIVKYGNVLTGYQNGSFVYETRKLPRVGFKFYAAENIYANNTQVFKAGEELTAKAWGNSHQVVIGQRTDENGRLALEDLPLGSYYCIETEFPQSFSKLPKRYYFEIEAKKTTMINEEEGGIYNEQAPATCHVYKVDQDTKKPLGGGEFTIYANVANTNYDGNAIFSRKDTVAAVVKRDLSYGKEEVEEGVWVPLKKVTTRADGKAEFGDLPVGKYLVTETKAPEGYALAEESYIFTHSYDKDQEANGYNFVHTFADVRTRSIQLQKHIEEAVAAEPEKKNMDAYIFEEKPGAGAVFGIYAAGDIFNTSGDKLYSADSLIAECTTDERGIAEWHGGYYAGDYYFRELRTPDDSRYILDDKIYPFSVTDTSGGVVNDPVINKLYRGSIKIIKTDGKTEVPLEGVEFDLLDAGKNKLGTYVTDKNGEILIQNLPVATYYLKETKAIKGYRLDDELKEVVITRENLNQTAELKNNRSDTSITVKTDTSITGGGRVKTGDSGLLGFIMALFLLSSTGAVVLLKRKALVKVKGLSVTGQKLLFIAGTLTGILILGGIVTQAASAINEIFTVELKDAEYNGTVYSYALQKQYETKDENTRIEFEEKLDGLTLADVEYSTLKVIPQTKVLEESRDYKDLLEKDESKIKDTITMGGSTYDLQSVTWDEESNIEHVSYTQDYGYAVSEPEPPAVYEYTYLSPLTNQENTVELPFVRMEKGDYGWVDGFTATVTFRNLDGQIFKLGSHEFTYNPDKLSFTESDYTELIKMLGYDTSKYRLTSASWSGKPYEGKNGERYRNATAYGQQYAASYKAVYEDDVENGKIYTAHATYTCEVEVPTEKAAPTFVMQATAYYKNASVWTNIITFVTEHKAATAVTSVAILLAVILAITFLLFNKQRKMSGKGAKGDEEI